MHFDESTYRRLRGDVYRFAYRHLGDHSASEDVVQDSFLRFAQYPSGSVGNIGGLLRRIANNLIIDAARFRTRRAEEALPETWDIPADEPDQETVLLERERMQQVSDILERMPEVRRRVFVMRRLHGMSAREVAAVLAITPAAVDTHVARAVLALHKGMTDDAVRDTADDAMSRAL